VCDVGELELALWAAHTGAIYVQQFQPAKSCIRILGMAWSGQSSSGQLDCGACEQVSGRTCESVHCAENRHCNGYFSSIDNSTSE
jgi:hypothetical protein